MDWIYWLEYAVSLTLLLIFLFVIIPWIGKKFT
jgi:hypothetical protein